MLILFLGKLTVINLFYMFFNNVSKTLSVFLSVHCLQRAYHLQNAITQLAIASLY